MSFHPGQAAFADAVNIAAFFLTKSCTPSGAWIKIQVRKLIYYTKVSIDTFVLVLIQRLPLS
jgi:uncharacterized phage-associated protein